MELTSRKIKLPTLGIEYAIHEWQCDEAAIDTPLLLIHGFLDSGLGFAPLVKDRLSKVFRRIIAPDMRGHGGSGSVAHGYYHFLDYIADITDIVDWIDAKDGIYLVGHSMGGSVAGYFAGSYPDKVAKLAILEGIGPRQDAMPMPARMRRWIGEVRFARARKTKYYGSVDEAAQSLQKRDKLLSADMAKRIAELTLRSDGRGHHFQYDRMHLSHGPYPYQTELAEQFWRAVTCPIVFIYGKESEFVADEEFMGRLTSFMPRAKQIGLEQAGHMLQRHVPDELTKHLTEFFRE